jgi:uncharacterized protein (DUF2252 family)
MVRRKPAGHSRAARLTQMRNLKMARSAHAYVRGNSIRFYEWLDASDAKLPHGPPVWICGDCHIGNLGPLADAKGHVAVQIRDLDQTVIGNPAHDLIRLGLSLASAARGSDLPGVITARMLEQVVTGYRAALAGHLEGKNDRTQRPELVQRVLKQAVRRRWRHLAEERLDDVKPTIPLGKRFWPLNAKERLALRRLFQDDAAKALISSLQRRADEDQMELVDAAYWVKGCSSLGRLRYAAVLRVGKGRHATICLVDVKECTRPAAPRFNQSKMPRDNAIRVITGAKALSPNIGDRMAAARLLDRSVVLRELMPQDLKIEIDRLTQDEAMHVARYLAGVVGRAHGRQMDLASRAQWRREMRGNHTKSLDAPSWLWSSVVELTALHEVAYLEHCRQHASSAA